MKIEVKNLTKYYGDLKALDQISFTIDEPKIYGLLGRNGAGKTTFMDILAGHFQANSGEIYIDGERPYDNRKLTESICLVKEDGNFKRELKIKEVLKIFSYFYPNWDQELAEELIRIYELNVNAKVKNLSKGMVSALGITVGLSSKAEITIFDEPYIGLDAAARQKFYDILLEEYQANKRTIILSTHLIDEVSLLFEEVLILRKGQLILKEDADTLRNSAYSVSGSAEEVEAFIKGQEVIHVKELAGTKMAYVFGNMEDAYQYGFTPKSLPIQELMMSLTEKGA